MPTNLTHAMIESAQDGQSTHNKVTSNAAAMLAIRLASRYLLKKTDIEVFARPAASSTAASSSAVSSSPAVATSVMTLDMADNSVAKKRMNHVIKRYDGRLESSKLEELTKAWLKETLGSRILSKELDRVTLVEEHNGSLVSTEWYLPLPEIYATVLSALMDKDELRWPVPANSTAENERLKRLQEFDRINNALAKAKPRICATGIRHAWLMALDGYEGKRLPLNAEDVLMQGLFDFMVHEVLGKQMNIRFPDGRDPVGGERVPLHAHFQSLLLPWSYGTMPDTVRDAIKNAGGSDASREFVLGRFRTIGIAPDAPMMQKINGYCSEEGLETIPCTFIPILATLEGHAKRQTLAASSGSIAATGIQPLALETLAWLQGTDFSPEALANPDAATDPFSTLYLVVRLHDALYHYKDYKNLLDVSDMPEEHKAAWVDALHFLRQCLHNPDLSLAPLLEDTAMLEHRLLAFERGFGVWRNNTYHDFISNYAANWFAASGDGGIDARANLFGRLCELFFQENTPENDSTPVIRVNDTMLIEWIARAGEDGIMEVTPYQINRVLLHALCYPEDTWSPLFRQCLPITIAFIRNRCNQEQNTAGEALSRDSWPEALLDQIERVAAPDSTGAPFFPVLLTPGNITTESSLDVAQLLAASNNMPEAIVRKIVQLSGFYPNAVSSEWLTPFYLAAEYGNIGFAAALLERGANSMVKFKGRFPPLQVAIDNQHFSFVQWLLQTLPEHLRVGVVLARNPQGNTMLHLVTNTHVELLKQILDCLPETERACAVMAKNHHNDTVLHIAAVKHPEILKQLLDCLPEEARVNAVMAKNYYGETVLHLVAKINPKLLIQLLNCLPEEARVNAVMAKDDDNENDTLLHLIANSSIELLKPIIDCLPEADKAGAAILYYTNGTTSLHLAIKRGPEILKQLLDYLPVSDRARPVMTANTGNGTLLHEAASDPESLELLLGCLPEEIRADALMTTNALGDTVLHQAANNPGSLQLVLDCLPEAARGSAVMVCNKQKNTPLHKAANNPKSLKLLLDCLLEEKRAGFVMARNEDGYTALHLAANNGASLNLLISYLPKMAVADAIQINDKFGNSVLHRALDYPESLKLLLNYLPEEERANAVMAKNYIGYTVMHLAVKKSERLNLLLDYLPQTARAGVLMAKSNKGDTVLHSIEDPSTISRLLLNYLPETTRADVLMITNTDGDTVLHQIAKNAPELLKQILDCLPKAARAGVLLVTNEDDNTVLHEVERSRPEILIQLLDSLPEETRAGAVMICNKYGTTVLHRTATNHPEILKQLLDCLPKAVRAEAVMARDYYGSTLLHAVARHHSKYLILLLNYLPDAAKADAVMKKNSDHHSVLDLVKRSHHSQSLHCIEEALEQAKQRATNQTSLESNIPHYDSGSGLSTPASSSDFDASAPLGSHSFFSQRSLRLQDPGSPEEQSTLKK
ncbi:ankyrin repeat domain-containing protein [Legionella bononiensis]|uniref:Ankyrin repeat domain-containing protein n=1 Tax=Legionella bononiensis TaxID=2793102 RepID=A0ABS1W8L6_9GAMM|nr:ankyrin repeat domain-containing protein [Legionella bononiensis]MBL7479820.1 ankyrin repeat domain-containing protein [Legionella bononiensis]MBL7525665.1 ankyrin repeat domain-containing protein [Legionella bononiensis]MBL7561848.1 ankyrin repeat domain-containing protein [Legionella bononiensis]